MKYTLNRIQKELKFPCHLREFSCFLPLIKFTENIRKKAWTLPRLKTINAKKPFKRGIAIALLANVIRLIPLLL